MQSRLVRLVSLSEHEHQEHRTVSHRMEPVKEKSNINNLSSKSGIGHGHDHDGHEIVQVNSEDVRRQKIAPI